MSDNFYQQPNNQLPPQPQERRKKFNPYLLGSLLGIAAAIIFLCFYKFVYLTYFYQNASQEVNPPSSASESLAELQADIEFFSAALDNATCDQTSGGDNDPPNDENLPLEAEPPVLSDGLPFDVPESLQEELPAHPPMASLEANPPPPPQPPPPPPPKPTPKPAPKPAPTPQEKPAPTTKPKDGPPTSVEQVSDLNGCWYSETGTASLFSGALYHSYCFDMSGNATSHSANKNLFGQTTSECRTSARAQMQGNNFTITEGKACPGWVSGVYTCRLIGPGVARCTLSFPNRPSQSVDFRYRG
ncbi:MAG: hypothetical protein LBE38_02470 [Deltaproteobacteria bacterium]|jgi:hypothetical protein|nr:hypothetical protein [Deltaproteobacteria bacterium]